MNSIWKKTLEKLKSKISDQNFSTWINPINPIKLNGNQLCVEVPNKFIKDWINDNYKKK